MTNNNLKALKFSSKIETINKKGLQETVSVLRKHRSKEDVLSIKKSLDRIAKKPSVQLFKVGSIKDVLGRPMWFVGNTSEYREHMYKIKNMLTPLGNGVESFDTITSEFFELYNPWTADTNIHKQDYYKKPNILIDVKNDFLVMFTSMKYAIGTMEAIYRDIYYKPALGNKYTFYMKNGDIKTSWAKRVVDCSLCNDRQSMPFNLRMSFYTVNKPGSSYIWDEKANNWVKVKPFKTME